MPAASGPASPARSRARALSLPPDHINAYLPRTSVPLGGFNAGLQPVDEGRNLGPVLGLARRNQVTESLRFDGEQRLGARAGIPDERVMDHVVVGQSGVAGEVLQGRPRIDQARKRD